MPTVVDLEKCEGCGDCVEACPTESIKIVDDKAEINADECADCGTCIDECPTKAISEE